VCMIGCPVGSIHRGNNREIVIEDWCIGCGMCAKQCPYGSIQMHDVGIIPEVGHGWRYLPADLAGERWKEPELRDRAWLTGAAPFYFDREMRAAIREAHDDAGRPAPGAEPSPICFRYEFVVDAAQAGSRFRMGLVTSDPAPQVFVNGKQITSSGKPKKGEWDYSLSATDPVIRSGRNVIAIRVCHHAKNELSDKPNESTLNLQNPKSLLMKLRLDEEVPARVPLGMLADTDVSQKLVEEFAVVCDLCSNTPTQVPACVNACPHDAAMRVDARFEFPTG
jgi:Fe-S-cluster-containing hydrogenase component 2